jgi:hypothetical protein
LESGCEKLVELLEQHGLLSRLCSVNSDVCHPDTFRSHGEYGLWIESVYDTLVNDKRPIAQAVLAQIQLLAQQMGIRGDRIP